jgi:hypothetical protein
MPAAGTTALYRPVPRDFDETFIRVGWSGIEAETAAHAKTVSKWLALRNDERIAGGLATLQQARATYVQQHGRARSPKMIADLGARQAA